MSADLPSYGQYDPYGYGNRAQQQPPMPDTVNYAFYLMLCGAALQVVGIVVTLSQMGTIRNTIRDAQLKRNSTLTDSQLNALVDVAIAAAVVFGLLYVGLWLWMAFKNRAGRHWARVTGTVFFGVDAVVSLISLVTLVSGVGRTNGMSAGTTAASWAINFITLLVGGATVLLLWNSRSSAYFARRAFQHGGYQPPSPYGGPPSPYGQPSPGMPPQMPPPPPSPGPGQGPGGFSPPA